MGRERQYQANYLANKIPSVIRVPSFDRIFKYKIDNMGFDPDCYLSNAKLTKLGPDDYPYMYAGYDVSNDKIIVSTSGDGRLAYTMGRGFHFAVRFLKGDHKPLIIKLDITYLDADTRNEKEVVEKIISIFPPDSPVPDRDYVVDEVDKPNPESPLYIHRSMFKNSDGSENHLVSGMRIVFEPGNELFNVFKPLTETIDSKPSPEGRIKELTVCADQLEVHGRLWLPETNVNIFCRDLIFKDLGGQAGCIDTSPQKFAVSKAEKFQDGADGRNAGDIAIYAKNEPTHNYNFIVDGGNGQDAGEGEDGKDGNSVECVMKVCYHFKEFFIYYVITAFWRSKCFDKTISFDEDGYYATYINESRSKVWEKSYDATYFAVNKPSALSTRLFRDISYILLNIPLLQ